MKSIAMAGVVLSIFSGSAVAQATSAQATLSGYGYQLIDLDLNDGIAPSITFSNALRGARASALPAVAGQPSEDVHWSESGEAVSASYVAASASAAAWYSATELNTVGTIGREGFSSAIAGWDADYTLSANTRLVFTGHAAAFLIPGASVAEQFAFARILVMFSAYDAEVQLPSYSRQVSTSETGESGFSEQFIVEIVNDSAGALNAWMSVTAYSGGGVVSPVPEPSSYLMLASGLVLTAAMARRRRVPGAR